MIRAHRPKHHSPILRMIDTTNRDNVKAKTNICHQLRDMRAEVSRKASRSVIAIEMRIECRFDYISD